MHTVKILSGIVENHQVLIYAIILLGIIFEGEFVIIFTGVLAHLGALNVFVAIIFILLGAFAKTFFGYALGQFLFKKFNHHRFFRYIQKRVYLLLPKFKTKPFWSIFISKFIIGANNVVIIFSGFEKINYKKYLKAEVLATVLWAPFLLSLGYIFSYTALQVSGEIWRFSMVVLVLVIMFILFDKLVSWIYELFEEYYNDRP